jgi:quercetin dioxygenase-like cupin family protein
MTLKTLSIDEVKGDEIMKGAVRKVLVHSKNLMLIYYEVEPGATLSHSHPHEQMGFVVKGSAELTAGGKTVKLGPGSSYLFDSNEHHDFRITGKGTIILDVFHPRRDDYLPK